VGASPTRRPLQPEATGAGMEVTKCLKLGFDTRPDFARIKAKALYILCRTDALFPPKIAPDVIEALTAAGVEARYFELDSDLGHSSSGPEHAKWSPVLREFLAPLVARLT
jgi:homoserine O-acetyltransferase